MKSILSNDFSPLEEDQLFEMIALEMAEGNVKAGLWTKALSESDGSELQTQSIYTKLRLQSIKGQAKAEKTTNKKRIFVASLAICAAFYGASLFVSQQEEAVESDKLTNMGYFLDWKKDAWAGKLPEVDDVKSRLAGMSDLDKVIEITKIVGGSRPIYSSSGATSAIAEATLTTYSHMTSPIGDCGMISKRFRDYSKHFGFKTELRSVLHDYIPGHVFNYTISPQGREYIVDIDHSIVIEINSNEQVTLHKLPPMVDYFFPQQVYGDSWASSESFFNWVEDIRNNRWRLYLEIEGIKHLREMQEGVVVTREFLSGLSPAPATVILSTEN